LPRPAIESAVAPCTEIDGAGTADDDDDIDDDDIDDDDETGGAAAGAAEAAAGAAEAATPPAAELDDDDSVDCCDRGCGPVEEAGASSVPAPPGGAPADRLDPDAATAGDAVRHAGYRRHTVSVSLLIPDRWLDLNSALWPMWCPREQ
jgi:hypothetical protein